MGLNCSNIQPELKFMCPNGIFTVLKMQARQKRIEQKHILFKENVTKKKINDENK